MEKVRLKLLILCCFVAILVGCRDSENEVKIPVVEAKEFTGLKIVASKFDSMEGLFAFDDGDEYQDIKSLLTNMTLGQDKPLDVKVTYDFTSAKSHDEYELMINTALMEDEGPDLILISYGEDYQPFIDSGIALDVSERLENFDRIHPALKNNHFVPIGIGTKEEVLMLNRASIFGYDSTVEWTDDTHTALMDSYYHQLKPELTLLDIFREINHVMNQSTTMVNDQGMFTLTNQAFIDDIYSLKETLTGGSKYTLTLDMTYEYFKTHLDTEWETFYSKISKGTEQLSTLNPYYKEVLKSPLIGEFVPMLGLNTLNPAYIHHSHDSERRRLIDSFDMRFTYEDLFGENYSEDISSLDMFTYVPNLNKVYSSWGFVVNRNSKNIDEAIAYLDYLLSEDSQMGLIKAGSKDNRIKIHVTGDHPVITGIEDKLLTYFESNQVPESLIQARQSVLNEITSGLRTRSFYNGIPRHIYTINSKEKLNKRIETYIKENIEDMVLRVCFDDRFDQGDLVKRLKDLEYELNMMINE